MARIRMETERAERTGFWQPFVTFAWRFAATAMVALVILLTYAVRGVITLPAAWWACKARWRMFLLPIRHGPRQIRMNF